MGCCSAFRRWVYLYKEKGAAGLLKLTALIAEKLPHVRRDSILARAGTEHLTLTMTQPYLIHAELPADIRDRAVAGHALNYHLGNILLSYVYALSKSGL